MKRFIKFVSVLALGLALASCSKEAPGKSEVEAGFDAFKSTLPQLTLGANPAINAAAGYAEVDLTIAGLADAEGLVVGVVSSTDPTFGTSNFVAVESPANGTVKVKAKVAPNSTYYIRAAASVAEGVSSYSEAITVNVPDVPFWAKAAGVYAGNTTAYTSDTVYSSVITVVNHPDDPENKCFIYDFNPYWAANGYTFAATEGQYNWLEAVIDNENNAIIIPYQTDMNLAGRVALGLDAPEYADAQYYDDIYLVLGNDGSSLVRANAFAVGTASGSLEEVFNGTVYAKQ